MSHKMTNEEFKAKATQIHGGFYDYSKTEYHDIKSPVIITCPIHGDFVQRAETHLRGHGCHKCANEKREVTMTANHGVNHAMQSDTVKAKAAATKLARFGQTKVPGSGRKRMTKDEFVARAREIHGDKYDYSKVIMAGTQEKVEIICPDHGSFFQTPAKHLNGRGCTHPDCIKAKKLESMKKAKQMKAESVQPLIDLHPEKTQAFIEKARKVHGDRYDYSKVIYTGSKNKVEIICPDHGPFMQAPERHLAGQGCPHKECVVAKCNKTNLKKYGVHRPLQSAQIHDKMAQTVKARYHVANVMDVPEIRARKDATCIAKYGFAIPLENPDVRKKVEETNIKLHGGRSPFSDPVVRESTADKILQEYGTTNVMHVPEIRAKRDKTCLSKYGHISPLGNSGIYAKVLDSKRENGTFNVSESENTLYEMLCSQFGSDDVIRQYRDGDYPFACDFYIPSRDLRIELNATWTHGWHWYGKSGDEETVKDWSEKHTDYYDNAIWNWTDLDVRKRVAARDACLNYVVFWDTKLRDAELWFVMGCPDGQDWDREYSWLPERHIAGYPLPDEKHMNYQVISRIVKHYQFDAFYHRELELWKLNPEKDRVSLQVFLYWNRWKYTKKLPNELSDVGIMRGFGISGILRSYTVFDTTLMQQVIDKYSIKSVYDPCAGWGERMLCCHLNHIPYLGVDINEKLFPGYATMWSHYNMIDQYVQQGDSAFIDISGRDYDAVLTCPPYGNTEIYSEAGAENLSKDDFLAWWTRVVLNSLNINPRLFCFQVNQRWKQEMADIVQKCGFDLVEEIDDRVKSSHMNRDEDGVSHKKEKETMLVFRNTSGSHRM